MSKKRGFLYGAAILGVAGLIGKIIGAFYRIPLASILEEQGVGLYSMAYPIYTALLMIATAGIPTAISKLISERLAQNDPSGAQRVFRNARRLLLGFGACSAVLLFACSGLLANLLHVPQATFPIMAIAPSLFFVSLISVYRGYYQGQQLMTPTALSMLLEQFFKLIAGLGLAIVAMRYFADSPMRYAWGATGTMVGITLSEGCALLYLLFRKSSPLPTALPNRTIDRAVLRRLLGIAVPITLGACVMPLVDLIDLSIVARALQAAGQTVHQATALYGVLKGMVNPIVNMPAILTLSLAVSLVPAISDALTRKDKAAVQQQCAAGLKLSLLIGLPSCVGLYLLARPVLELLYPRSQMLDTGTMLMHSLSFAILALSVVQTTTGLLQGIGRIYIPVVSLLAGALCKIAITYFLVTNPEIGINGAAIGTVVCYTVAAGINTIAVLRIAHVRVEFFATVIKPLFAATAMAASVSACNLLLPDGRLITLLNICVGMVVYVVCLLVVRTFSDADFQLLPGGRRIQTALSHLRIRR